MVAIGVNEDGHHEVVGYAEGFTEPAESHRDFLSWPKSRWLRGIRMLTGDKAYRKAEISRNTAYGHLAKNDPSRPGHPSIPLFALGASTRATRQSRCLRPAPTGPGAHIKMRHPQRTRTPSANFWAVSCICQLNSGPRFALKAGHSHCLQSASSSSCWSSLSTPSSR